MATKKYQDSFWSCSYAWNGNENQMSAARTLLQAKLQARASKKKSIAQGRWFLRPSTVRKGVLWWLFSFFFLKGVISSQFIFLSSVSFFLSY